jgi:nucleotide-binding universal stress UspA family protein
MSVQRESDTPRIVAGVDGSPSSLAALRWAVRQAVLTGGVVEAIMAWQYPVVAAGYGWAPAAMVDDGNYQEISEKVLAEATSDGIDPGDQALVRPRVVEGNASRVLLDAAADADLLVVGSRGHGGFTEALLGSVSQNCVHHARCPVVIVRGDEQGTGTPKEWPALRVAPPAR